MVRLDGAETPVIARLCVALETPTLAVLATLGPRRVDVSIDSLACTRDGRSLYVGESSGNIRRVDLAIGRVTTTPFPAPVEKRTVAHHDLGGLGH